MSTKLVDRWKWLSQHWVELPCARAAKECGSEELRTLGKGLACTLSVVVRAPPKQDFQYLSQLVDSCDLDVLLIVRENRLVKNFPGEVR